jgi:lipopolysaccharide/colanic/teichoic acid biosynthesis glycosyltransferase
MAKPAMEGATGRSSVAERTGRAVAIVAGALAGALVVVLVADGPPNATVTVVAFLILALAGAALRRDPGWAHLLPLMGRLARLAGPLTGAAAVLVVLRLGWLDVGTIGFAEALLVAVVTAGTTSTVQRLLRVLAAPAPVRIGVLGSPRVTAGLERELRLAGLAGYQVVGRIGPAADADDADVPTLGPLEDLRDLVLRHDLGLLLLAGDVSRLAVFDEFTGSCLGLDVRLIELSTFHERAFGHVAVADINSAWFRYLMESASGARRQRGKRALDLVVAGLLALPALLVVGLLALLIRRDGGPALFRQLRIGEGGRPFLICKLRTMRVDASPVWASAVDDRVTPLGRVLRRTHLDELPQVLNVLRGEMSIVGPRPEQPGFVARLEHLVPFYARRHLVKPGLTGWAQVRCGYAGSDVGSAWKVAHDLYYLKHRSFRLDLIILGETLRTLVADPQYSAEPASVDFILAPTREDLPIEGRAGVDAVPDLTSLTDVSPGEARRH